MQILLFVMFSMGNVAQSEEISLSEIWKIVSRESSSIESSHLEVEAAKVSLKSAENHWFPRVFIQAKSFVTNDPGPIFFGLLEQRSVTTLDFDPGAINHPAQHQINQGVLGVDLTLYEGGAGLKRAEQAKLVLQSQKFQEEQSVNDIYLRTVSLYGQKIVLEKQINRIQEIRREIQTVLQKYQLGGESNLIGHSGLLGLRSLQNRISGIELQSQAEIKAIAFQFKEIGFDRENWSTTPFMPSEFTAKFLASAQASNSPRLLAAKAQAEAAKSNVEISKSHLLPRLGGFAESNFTQGSRDTGSGYNIGLYLTWNLISPQEWNGSQEAKLKAQTHLLKAATLERNETSQREIWKEQVRAISENLILMDESYKNLMQQSKISYQLFRNGSLSALQLAEIMSRRTDLISQESASELSLIQASAQMMANSHFEIESKPDAESKK